MVMKKWEKMHKIRAETHKQSGGDYFNFPQNGDYTLGI